MKIDYLTYKPPRKMQDLSPISLSDKLEITPNRLKISHHTEDKDKHILQTTRNPPLEPDNTH